MTGRYTERDFKMVNFYGFGIQLYHVNKDTVGNFIGGGKNHTGLLNGFLM